MIQRKSCFKLQKYREPPIMLNNFHYSSDSLNDESDSERSESGSPRYSDHVSSDIEDGMYQKIHHAGNLYCKEDAKPLSSFQYVDATEPHIFSLTENSGYTAPNRSVCKNSWNFINQRKGNNFSFGLAKRFLDIQTSTPNSNTKMKNSLSNFRNVIKNSMKRSNNCQDSENHTQHPNKSSKKDGINFFPRRVSAFGSNSTASSKIISETVFGHEKMVHSAFGLSKRFTDNHTSAPENKFKEYCTNDLETSVQIIDESTSSEDVVLVGFVNGKRKFNAKADNENCIMIDGDSSNSSCNQKPQYHPGDKPVSVNDSSEDSSIDVMCIDSINSDDMMINTNFQDFDSNCSSFLFNRSVNFNLRKPLDISDYNSFVSDDSNEQLDPQAWQIDAEDRNRDITDKKSRKRSISFCKNCKNSRHSEKRCWKTAHVKCYLCGGNHKYTTCKRKVCGSCFAIGHDRNQCAKNSKRKKCSLCQVFGHAVNRCPDIWRRYHLTTSTESITKGSENEEQNPGYCYNCGEDGHFGYQCFKPRLCRESRASLPYVISYKNPVKLMQKSSKEIQTQLDSGSGVNSKLKKKMKNNLLNQHLSVKKKHNKKLSMHKKIVKQLISQGNDFERTPRSECLSDSEIPEVLKKKQRRKKKMKTEMLSQSVV